MRSELTIRGTEKFSRPPVSKAVKIKRPESMIDVQRRAILQMRAEEEARIKTEEEFRQDFLDFSYITEVDEYGLPLSTPYGVPDSVPDVYIPSQPETPTEEKKSAVSTEGSASEPSDGGAQ